MHHENRVIWGEGMFLRPQHFQQADRWTERMLYLTLQMTGGYFWGIAGLEIDTGALIRGELALLQLRAVLPDGSLIEAPVDAALPPPLRLEENSAGHSVYLTLSRRSVQTQSIFREDQTGLSPSKRTRITAREINLPDANGDSDQTAPVEVGQYNLQLISGQSGATDHHLKDLTVLELARIFEVRPDKSVLLDENFIPPCLNCSASPKLISYMKEISGLIAQRADALAERVGNPTLLNLSETADFLFLSALNRAEPLLADMLNHAVRTHPAIFFRHCLTLSGDMAAFTKPSKRPPPLPAYNHDDLDQCFSDLIAALRDDLSVIIEKRIIAINLVKKQFGLYVGALGDPALLENAACILAVQSPLSEEEIRFRLPSQIKIGPIEEIATLVKVAIAGIRLQTLTTVPRQLPYQPSTTYFELDRNTPLWNNLCLSKAIALHLAAPFPELQMQIWVLKK